MSNEYPNPQPYAPTGPRRLTRSRIDRKISGVCGGAAVYAGIDPTAMRLLMVAATVFTGGVALLLYLAGWVLMPEE